jgi:ubiquinone biosynthesis protein
MDFGPVLLGVPLPLWLALGIIAAGIAWLMKPRR